MEFFIVTNNPIVKKNYENSYKVDFRKESYKELIYSVKSFIENGYRLLSHPLSGSVKPNETPYKSVLLSSNKNNDIELNSLKTIIQCIDVCEKFDTIKKKDADDDFKLIDMSLIDSAINSAKIYNC